MKVVLFCVGLGTRIREYSENIPKPMVPIGHQPILWHVMQYYSQYGHQDFVLCLGYKANAIREYFLEGRPSTYGDCIVSDFGRTVEVLGERPPNWRVALVDTGVWRNIGERLLAVRHLVEKEEIFLANYSDQLSDLDLEQYGKEFLASGAHAGFLSVRPPLSYHYVEAKENGIVERLREASTVDHWINGGYFIFRKTIFDYMQPGEELVVEPFARLAAKNLLWTKRYDGFWQSMDTFKDKITFDRMEARGNCPWMVWQRHPAA